MLTAVHSFQAEAQFSIDVCIDWRLRDLEIYIFTKTHLAFFIQQMVVRISIHATYAEYPKYFHKVLLG